MFTSAARGCARIGITCLLLSQVVAEATAQKQSPPDSLVSYWLKRGALASWSPSLLYRGCPRLEEWQKRGIDLLLAAPLSAVRTRDFAIAMSGSLRCNDPRLNQWYFDHIEEGMTHSDDPATALVFWDALEGADTPGIRAFLRSIMLDANKAESYRSLAGGKLFGKFGKEERLQEYMALFATGQMPFEIAVGTTALILQEDSERLFSRIAALVREQPELTNQAAFTSLVENSHRYASAKARRRLSDALEFGLTRPGLLPDQQMKLRSMAIYLREPPK